VYAGWGPARATPMRCPAWNLCTAPRTCHRNEKVTSGGTFGTRALGRGVQDIWFEVQDTGCGVQDMGSGIQEIGCRVPLLRCSMSYGRSADRLSRRRSNFALKLLGASEGKENNLNGFTCFHLIAKALTVLYVPYSLDNGFGGRALLRWSMSSGRSADRMSRRRASVCFQRERVLY